MAIHCIFCVGTADPPCRALAELDVAPDPELLSRLEVCCCRSGRFIGCPIFQRVEQGLRAARASLESRALLAAPRRTAAAS